MADEPKRPPHRPSIFTQEMADTICERIAQGESLVAICRDPDMPGTSTVFRWLAASQSFRDMYAQARDAQADTLADEIVDIADDASNDWMRRNGKDGSPGWVENGEHARRSQLRIEARKWIAAKLKPVKYGDRQTVDLNVRLEDKSDLELYAEACATANRLGLPKPDARVFGIEE